MSREVIIRIRDDFDGSDADETLTFSYRGESYEIDLNSDNVELFDKSMQQWVDAARKVEPVKVAAASGAAKRRSSAAPKLLLEQRRLIRSWAQANGFDVQERGMIAGIVVEAFLAANPTVTLLPGVVGNYQRRADAPAVTTVTAQQGESGLIPVAELMRDRAARDQRGELLGKPKREAIRAWANKHGFEQAATGQIKRAVLDAYYAKHPEKG